MEAGLGPSCPRYSILLSRYSRFTISITSRATLLYSRHLDKSLAVTRRTTTFALKRLVEFCRFHRSPFDSNLHKYGVASSACEPLDPDSLFSLDNE